MKNKIITVLVMLCLCDIVHAQEKKVDIGFNLYPNYSKGILSTNGNTPEGLESEFKKMQTWKPSISANIFMEYKWSEKSFLGLGLGYQNNGEGTKKMDSFYGNSGIADPALPTHSRFVYNHHNLEIPLYYKLAFGKNFFSITGISGIINLSNTTTAIQYFEDDSKKRKKEEDKSTEFRRVNFSINVGFGVDFLTTDQFTLYVLPYAQYGVLGISKNAWLNQNFLSLGLSTGIRI